MSTTINRLTGLPVTTPIRLVLGMAITAGGVLALLAQALLQPNGPDALSASLLAGAATGLGALVLLCQRRPQPAQLDRLLLLAAGMMLAAALFSLLLPALDATRHPFALDVAVALLAGWLLMRGLDRAMPHQHPTETSGQARPAALKLLVVAIAVHNVPEGFAVGAGFGGGVDFGGATALSIGIQNIPEGLVVATALWSMGLSRIGAAAGALLTGLVEPLGAALGLLAGSLSDQTLPLALGLAAGAMLFVVIDELGPVVLRRLRARTGLASALLPLAAGFTVMVAAGLVGGG